MELPPDEETRKRSLPDEEEDEEARKRRRKSVPPPKKLNEDQWAEMFTRLIKYRDENGVSKRIACLFLKVGDCRLCSRTFHLNIRS